MARLGRLPLLLVPGALLACGPRLVEVPVLDAPRTRVLLRHSEEKGEPIPRGYEHPATVADVRLAHILARLTYESASGRRNPVFRSEQIYDLAEGLAKAFGRATPADEVAAAAFAEERRLGIFTRDRVTSFRAYFEAGQLIVELYDVESVLEEPGVANEAETYRIPTRVPSHRGGIRLVPDDGIALAGPTTFAIDWRDPVFRKPVGLSVRGGGIRRPTILMEAPEEGGPEPAPRENLTDAEVRALDQLEAARRSGLLTEAEFQRRRRLVLEGRFDEAGYGVDP